MASKIELVEIMPLEKEVCSGVLLESRRYRMHSKLSSIRREFNCSVFYLPASKFVYLCIHSVLKTVTQVNNERVCHQKTIE